MVKKKGRNKWISGKLKIATWNARRISVKERQIGNILKDRLPNEVTNTDPGEEEVGDVREKRLWEP